MHSADTAQHDVAPAQAGAPTPGLTPTGWRPWLTWMAVTTAVVAALALLPGRADIAPLISDDNAYIFLAADNLYEGRGPVATPPMAPDQPWSWRGDWTVLTQWPLGYPLLICATRLLLGTATASAAVALGVLSCAVALVAWFAWTRRCLPRRLPAALIAAVAAGTTFSVGHLVNPASDTVLLALVPLTLLFAHRALDCGTSHSRAQHNLATTALVGLLAGTLLWIRYAALFVPVGIGLFLTIDWLLTGRTGFRRVLVFGMAALIPLAALVMYTGATGSAASAQEQFNLGRQVSFDFRPECFATAWMLFTRQTLYAHRPEAVWFFSLVLPLASLGLPLALSHSRRALLDFLRSPPVLLSIVIVVTLFIQLIAASTLFQGKFDYVGLARYYQPIKPFYFLLFVGPVLAFRPKMVRLLACVPLVMAGTWFVNQDARPTLSRWLAADRPATSYGRWARRFEPDSTPLYRWLAEQRSRDLVVFSNFHEEIALETRIPACPTPRDAEELEDWLAAVKRVRGVQALRVLFVLDPSNGSRDYFLPPPELIVERFSLTHAARVPDRIHRYVYTWQSECFAGNSPAKPPSL